MHALLLVLLLLHDKLTLHDCHRAIYFTTVGAFASVGNAAVGQLKLCDFGFARPLPANNGSITDYVSTR